MRGQLFSICFLQGCLYLSGLYILSFRLWLLGDYLLPLLVFFSGDYLLSLLVVLPGDYILSLLLWLLKDYLLSLVLRLISRLLGLNCFWLYFSGILLTGILTFGVGLLDCVLIWRCFSHCVLIWSVFLCDFVCCVQWVTDY